MASEMLTLAQVSSLQGRDPIVPIIEGVTTEAPELTRIPGRAISGTSYKAVIRTALPSKPGFRRLGSGVEAGVSSYATKTFETHLVERQMQVDSAMRLATGDYSMDQLKAMEIEGQLRAEAIELGQQFYKSAPAQGSLGFPGLLSFLNSNLVVDATGTSTGCYRAWFIRTGIDGVHWIWGNNQGLQTGQWFRQRITDADGKFYTGEVNEITGAIGLSCADPYAVGCIKNIKPGTSGKELTDKLAYSLVSKFPAGRKPNLCLITPNVNFTLQDIRSSASYAVAGDATGGNRFAPLPSMIAGCEIIETDSIASETAS